MTTQTVVKKRSTVYVEEDLWQEVRQLALDEGSSATALVKEALRDLLKKRNGKK